MPARSCAVSCASRPPRWTSATWWRPGTASWWPPGGRADAMTLPVITVVGPTATGKSGLSLQLAAALGGEIINADSMQLYRGMDIGTAKLTPAERAGVPHHLLDIWEVTEAASVSE